MTTAATSPLARTRAVGSWPDANDYRDALQHPAKVFSDPHLQACRPKLNGLGVPKPSSGNLAIVYRLEGQGKTTAVRVFKFEQRERESRYQAVHDHLRRCGRPRCILDFRYESCGIRVNGGWYPMLTMEWVRGRTLDEWLREAVEGQDHRAIARLAEQWAELVGELRAARIAHGDLQHGNILVVQDRPVLVDYDCMCVPALVDQESLEEGLPAYQHPERGAQALSLDMDHFSAWVIFIALRAVAADLDLWARYVGMTQNENLLFTKDDLRAPEQSSLWPDLLASPDSEVRGWARGLREALAAPFAHIPAFEVDPFRRLAELCSAAVKDWDAIHRLACQPHLTARTFPPNLAGVRNEARRRTAARDRLRQAVDAGSLRAIAGAYEPTLLDDWRVRTPLAVRGREAVDLVKALDELEAARAADNGRQLMGLWARHGARLAPYPEAAAVKQQAERWQARIRAYDEFRTVRNRPASTERAIADAWQQLVAVGGHPDADADRPRGELAVRRADLLDRLRAAAADESEDNDRGFVRLWDDDLFKGCREAAALWPRVEAVRRRLAALDDLRAAVEKVEKGEGGEEEIVAAATPPRLPPGYPHHLATRVARARVRVALGKKFLDLVRRPDATEREVAAAWEQVHEAGAYRPALAPYEARAELARERVALLDQLHALPEEGGEDADRRFAAAWRTTLLKDCGEAEALRTRLQGVLGRLRLLEQLAGVIERANSGEGGEGVVLAAARALPEGYAHRLAGRVREARRRVALRKQLEQALAGKPASDRAIAAAWEAAKSGLRLDRAMVARCEQAIRRRDCLARLEAIDPRLPPDEWDACLLAAWDEELLDGCHDAAALRPRREVAVARTAAWRALEESLRTRDLERIGALAADPLLTDYPPARRRRSEIEELLRRAEQVGRVFGLLKAAAGAEFTQADLELVRTNPDLFEPRREQIEKALAAWLAKAVRLRPCDPPYTKPNVRARSVTVRFLWPGLHFGRVFCCRVAVSGRHFFDDPAEPDGTAIVYAEAHSRVGGAVVGWEPEWEELWVSIWPVVDLDWAGEVVGPPLHVGPIPLR